MPSSGVHRSAGMRDTHKAWRDSTPTTPFPFTYHDAKEGRIHQSWRDIHEKLGRDAINQAMPFCTAHIVPSTAQHNCIAGMIRSEQRCLRRTVENKIRPASAGAATVSSTASESLLAGSSFNSTTSKVRQRVLDAKEKDTLLAGEGGGRARSAFLKLRAQKPVAARYPVPRTTAQLYGWGLEDEDGNFQRPFSESRKSKMNAPDFRKKSCVRQMSRSSGVFDKPDFAFLNR